LKKKNGICLNKKILSNKMMNKFECDGVNVFFLDWDTRKISGWNDYIKLGDLVHCEMESGKIAEFKIIEFKRMMDPKDQFFGKVEDVGYV
jgi:hypothetical protein